MKLRVNLKTQVFLMFYDKEVMLKVILIFLYSFSPLCFAGVESIRGDSVSLIEHVSQLLSSLPDTSIGQGCGDKEDVSHNCSSVISSYMKDRDSKGFFSVFVDESPKNMCSSVELNDNYYTSANKLDDFFQEYTHGLVPSFESVNKACLKQLPSLKDQNSAISYYYYAQMRVLQDGILTLNSSAAIDKKLGRPILEGMNCADLGSLAKLCTELQTCSPSTQNLSNDIADTKMALNLKEGVSSSKPENESQANEKKQILGGLKKLYPWIEGREFKKSLDNDNLEDDKNIENAIISQLSSTREKLVERIKKYDYLTNCIDGQSHDCDDFHKELNELSKAPIVGAGMDERNILAGSYQRQQVCINNQTNYRDNINESSREALLGSALAIGTMGLGTVAVGSGHIIKGVQSVGALNRAQKVHRTLATLSVQNANKVKLGAKYLSLSLNGVFSARGVKDAITSCQKDLSHLVEFKRLIAPNEKPTLCPKDNQNPEFQLMSDIKSCVINAALSSLDFIPAIPYGVAKFRSTRMSQVNKDLLEESQWIIDPQNMKTKLRDSKYIGEEQGLADIFRVMEQQKGFEDFKYTRVKYMQSKAEQQKYKVHISEGKLYNSSGAPLDSPNELEGIFVMDKSGNMYYQPNPEIGVFHHTSFLAGDEVISAGQLRVEKGKVKYLDNGSGHYKPEAVHHYQGIYNLIKSGADLSDAEVKFRQFIQE